MDSNQTSEQSSVTVNSQPVVPAQVATPLWRDLLIPASIVLAGVAVGLGLYFSGSSGSTGTLAAPAGSTETFQERVVRLADNAGVKERDLNRCIEERGEEMGERVQEDFANAAETGGGGTPWSIVVGPNGKTYPLNGAVPAQAVQQIIELARSEGELPSEAPDANTDAVNPVTDGDWIKGSANAAVTVIEYSDYDCPFCGRFHTTMDQVVAANDDVAWVYRHSPIDQLHPNARTVAIAAECVGELEGNEAFWTFTDAYFAGS